MAYSTNQFKVPGPAAIRFLFLGWERTLQPYDIFVMFALLTNIQVERVSEGKQKLQQALDPQQATWAVPKPHLQF